MALSPDDTKTIPDDVIIPNNDVMNPNNDVIEHPDFYTFTMYYLAKSLLVYLLFFVVQGLRFRQEVFLVSPTQFGAGIQDRLEIEDANLERAPPPLERAPFPLEGAPPTLTQRVHQLSHSDERPH